MPNASDASIGQDAAVCGAGRQTPSQESQRSNLELPNSPPVSKPPPLVASMDESTELAHPQSADVDDLPELRDLSRSLTARGRAAGAPKYPGLTPTAHTPTARPVPLQYPYSIPRALP